MLLKAVFENVIFKKSVDNESMLNCQACNDIKQHAQVLARAFIYYNTLWLLAAKALVRLNEKDSSETMTFAIIFMTINEHRYKLFKNIFNDVETEDNER